MAFSSNSSGGPMADINVTPLVDVMLVLLIIFMVTAPALSYPIQVDLPQPSTNPPPTPKDPPEPIRIRIDAAGTVLWNGSPTRSCPAVQHCSNAAFGRRFFWPRGTRRASARFRARPLADPPYAGV
jgi:biopolymer transport protein ExbD